MYCRTSGCVFIAYYFCARNMSGDYPKVYRLPEWITPEIRTLENATTISYHADDNDIANLADLEEFEELN